jgi:ribose transport system ATP-binding protein
MASEIILETQGISKRFAGVIALSDVSLKAYRGEVHAIVGENGAGKSTLMKILAGAYKKDSGKIIMNAKEIVFQSPLDAQNAGIAIIYQEFNLAPHLSAEANIYIGREPRTKWLGLIKQSEIHKNALELFSQLNINIDPQKEVRHLSVCQQQMTEIAKALSINSSLLIMDEPTSALPENEVKDLFAVIRQIRNGGVSVLYISHCLEDVFQIADRISVLRDGKLVATDLISNINRDQVVSWMVGRDISDLSIHSKRKNINEEPVVLEVSNLCRGKVINNVSFKVHRGEILGIAGLLGSGRTELLRCIFGADPKTSGTIYLNGETCSINSPKDAVICGIAYVPEDRKQQGLFLGLASDVNLTAASVSKLARFGFINIKNEHAVTSKYVDSMAIKLASHSQQALHLSGGNQQKVLIARWLAIQPKVLLLDDPTRGIDIGARAMIHELIRELAGQGICVVFVSSELPEVIKMSDRILVMAKGQIAGEFSREEVTQEKIMAVATETMLCEKSSEFGSKKR